MTTLSLSDTERLLLANQYEILGLLKKDDSYTRMADDLRDGHRWLYEQHAVEICPNLSEDDTQHVLNILGIFGDLRSSYEELADTSEIPENLVKFPGFDGNNETDLLHFCRALRRANLFHETIGEEAKNSHMPTTEMYRRMIAEWKTLGEPLYPLTAEQVKRITSARVHPTHRTQSASHHHK